MSGNVGTDIVESGLVENVGVAVGISRISHSIPEIQLIYSGNFKIFRYILYFVDKYIKIASFTITLAT